MVLSTITQVANVSLAKLETIWNDIGEDCETKTSAQEAIAQEFERMLNRRIGEEEARRDALTAEVSKVREDLQRIAMELGEAEGTFKSAGTGSLKMQMQEALVKAEEAQQAKMQRVKEIEAAHDAVLSLFLDLNDELSDEQKTFLGVSSTEDLTLTRLQHLSARREVLEQEKVQRQQSVKVVTQTIWKLWNELCLTQEEACSGPFEKKLWNGLDVGVKESTLSVLASIEGKWQRELDTRQEQHSEMQRTLKDLWELLQVDSEEQDTFLATRSDFSSGTIEGMSYEISRLQIQKQEKMAALIAEARAQLETIWTEMRLSTEEKAAFSLVHAPALTEETLVHCKEEIERSSSKLALMQPILKVVGKRERLRKEAAELEAASHDSDRLLSRGKRDPGRLLREEKVRNMVAKELPKMEDMLKTSMTAWEKDHGAPFTVDGVAFLEQMQEEHEAALREREEARLKHKHDHENASNNLKTPRKMTPARPQSGQRRPTSATKEGMSSASKSVPRKTLGQSNASNVVALGRM